MCNLVGKENVIYSAIHFDENTPHMHFYFTPVVHEVKRKVFETDKDGHQILKPYITKDGIEKMISIQKKDENGKNVYEIEYGNFLNSDQFWKEKGFKTSYAKIQDDYNKFINEKGFNLDRGEVGANKHHLTKAEKQWDFNLRKFYNKLEPFKTPGALKKEMDFYEPEEFFKFISVVDDLRYKCFFELLYYCGLRRSEARGLQWKHIDFKNKLLTVSQQVLNPSNSNASTEWYISSTKTEASNRTIPIATTLLNDLEELKKSNERIAKFKQTWFVLGDDVPMATGRMYFYRDKYAEKAGVKQIRLHDFRHSCASLLIYKGASINMVSKFLGHSKIEETLNTYTHLYSNALSDITNLIDEMNES